MARYNQPAAGSTDWDIPLNDNFASLSDDVEIRDTEANLGDYSPNSNRKFFATDTEKIYLADGSSWNEVADLSNIGSGGTTAGAVAEPGNVQSVINNVYDGGAGRGLVALDSTQTYTFNDIDVKTGVVLDCCGATIEPDSDSRVFNIWTDSKLTNCRIDITNFGSFSSDVIRLSTDFNGGYIGANEGPYLDSVALVANQNDVTTAGGTFVHILTSSNTSGESITMSNFRDLAVFTSNTTLSGQNQSIGTGIHLESQSSYMNSLIFNNVQMASCNTFVLQSGSDEINGNRFKDFILQPEDGNNSDIGWDIQTGGRNKMTGYFWDNSHWSTASVRVGSGAGDHNVLQTTNIYTDLRDQVVYNGGQRAFQIRKEYGHNAEGLNAINSGTDTLKVGETAACYSGGDDITVNLPDNATHGEVCDAIVRDAQGTVQFATENTADFDFGDRSNPFSASEGCYQFKYILNADTWIVIEG